MARIIISSAFEVCVGMRTPDICLLQLVVCFFIPAKLRPERQIKNTAIVHCHDFAYSITNPLNGVLGGGLTEALWPVIRSN